VALRRSKPRGLGRSYGGFECEKVEMGECKKVKNDRTLFGGRRFNMGWGVILLKESHEGTGYAEKAYG
jgi:hypothetical protein